MFSFISMGANIDHTINEKEIRKCNLFFFLNKEKMNFFYFILVVLKCMNFFFFFFENQL